MQLKLPPKVKYVIDSLEARGFEAYAVGGCVRDMVLGKEPKDYDITTNARPDEIKRVFNNTVDTGIQHGTVTVVMYPDTFEVTTYRADGDYNDSRHPESVSFLDDIRGDLERRDFTINAMAYHEKRGLVDLFCGMEDLAKKTVRCVGVANDRFSEDALRVMRAYRFAAQLGFSIDEETRKAACDHAKDLLEISAERKRDELMKILTSDHPDVLIDMYRDNVTAVVLPEFDACMETEQNSKYHIYNVGEHTIRSVLAIRPDPALRLAMLLHDFGKPKTRTTNEDGTDHFYGHPEVSAEMAKDILRRFKFDNATSKKVVTLVKYHDYRPEPNEKSVRKAARKIGPDNFLEYLEVQRADASAQEPMTMERNMERIKKVEEVFSDIIKRGDALSVAELEIDGNDLIKMGYEGKTIGEVLNFLLEAVTDDPSINSKEKLIEYVEDNYGLQKGL